MAGGPRVTLCALCFRRAFAFAVAFATLLHPFSHKLWPDRSVWVCHVAYGRCAGVWPAYVWVAGVALFLVPWKFTVQGSIRCA